MCSYSSQHPINVFVTFAVRRII